MSDRARFDPARWAPLPLATLLLFQAGLLVHAGLRAARYPYEIDYGEGVVWYQARLLFAGEAYGDIAGFPAIVFHYPPVYHFFAGGFEAIGFDGLVAGRLLSLVATAAMALFAGLIAHWLARAEEAPPQAARIVGLVAGLLVPALSCVQSWAALMRVDMLALAWGFGGFYLVLLALRRPKLIHAASLAFVLAVYTKQTSIAAPAAVFGVLLFVRPRLAWTGIVTCLVAGLAALAFLTWATDAGFVRHVFLYNVNRFDWTRLRYVGELGAGHLVILAFAACALWTRRARLGSVWARRSPAAPGDIGLAMLALYLGLTLVMLPMAAKQGSNVNYFIEWLVVAAVFCGLALRGAAESLVPGAGRRPRARVSPALLWIALAVQIALLPKHPYALVDDRRLSGEMAALRSTVADADGPVISDDMVLLMRAGRPVLWEPAIFGELAATGVWDERPFVAMLRRHEFALVISMYSPGEARFRERYTPAVAAAISGAYPHHAVFADRHIYLSVAASEAPAGPPVIGTGGPIAAAAAR